MNDAQVCLSLPGLAGHVDGPGKAEAADDGVGGWADFDDGAAGDAAADAVLQSLNEFEPFGGRSVVAEALAVAEAARRDEVAEVARCAAPAQTVQTESAGY